MQLPARPAQITAIQVLCLSAVGLMAAPAAAQSGDTDLFPSPPSSQAPAPVGAPVTSGPTDLFIPPPPPPAPAPPQRHDLPAPDARWQVEGGLSGSVYTIHNGPGIVTDFDAHRNDGSVYVGPKVFLSPVVDNDAPRSVQPFLQRTSSVYGYLSGRGVTTRYRQGASTRTVSSVAANMGADVYVTRYLALTGGFRYGYDVLHDEPLVSKGHSFSGDAGFGIRLGDARINASYSFSAYDANGTFNKPAWGTIALSAYLFLVESFGLTLGGHGSDGSAGGSVDLGFYTSKDFGVFAGFSGQTFVNAARDVRIRYYTGSAGFSYWVSPGLRLGCSYVLSLESTPSQPARPNESHTNEHSLSIGMLARLP